MVEFLQDDISAPKEPREARGPDAEEGGRGGDEGGGSGESNQPTGSNPPSVPTSTADGADASSIIAGILARDTSRSKPKRRQPPPPPPVPHSVVVIGTAKTLARALLVPHPQEQRRLEKISAKQVR